MMHQHKSLEVYLNSGELVFASSPCMIKTILGSCVGVALYDPRLKYGGMCHYLLGESASGAKSTKYGNIAIPTLIHRFSHAGSRIEDIRAYVAGGALLLDQHEIFFVGENNIKMALTILNEYHIKIVRQDTGGDRGRKMWLNTINGDATIDFITHVETPQNGIF